MRARQRLLTRLRAVQQDRHQAERGSVTLWLVIFALVAVTLLILVVDGGQVIVAKSRAADIAEQAARAAADDINPASLRSGQVAVAAGACDQGGPATSLISTYSQGVGVTASMKDCHVGTDAAGAPDVTVRVLVSTGVLFPSPFFPGIHVQATETAYLACGSADARTAC
jgi:Putative Flp pilus-assembly TadE/G-like